MRVSTAGRRTRFPPEDLFVVVNALSGTYGRPWTRTAAIVLAFALLLGVALQLAVSADAEGRQSPVLGHA